MHPHTFFVHSTMLPRLIVGDGAGIYMLFQIYMCMHTFLVHSTMLPWLIVGDKAGMPST